MFTHRQENPVYINSSQFCSNIRTPQQITANQLEMSYGNGKKGTKIIFFGATAPQWATAFSFTRFPDHTQRHTTVSRTPLDERSPRRRDLYLTTHNTHNRQTSMPSVGFEPTISASERPQTHTLDRAATGTGH